MNEPLEGRIDPFADIRRALNGKPGEPLEPILGEVCCVETCPFCGRGIAIPRSRYNERASYACEPCGKVEMEKIRQRVIESNKVAAQILLSEMRRHG